LAKLAIIGTGLIGTSLALALKKANLKDVELVGTDSDGAARRGAERSKAFHKVENRLIPAVHDAEIVVLATPIMAMQELMEVIGPELPEGCLVTDVGSSKRLVLDWAEQYLPKTVNFVGGHPMAGKETAGPENGRCRSFPRQSVLRGPRPQRGAKGGFRDNHLGRSGGRPALFHRG